MWQLHQRNYIISADSDFIKGKVRRYRPILYHHSLQTAKRKTHALPHWVFSLSYARFSLESVAMYCVDSSRSSCHLQSLVSVIKGFHCVWEKPDGLVCLQQCLVAALPRPSSCRVLYICLHSDWLTGVQTSCYVSPPSQVKLCPVLDPDISVTLSQ